MVSGASELMKYKVTNLKTQVLPLHLTGVTLDKSIKHVGSVSSPVKYGSDIGEDAMVPHI